jgi:glycosyltransferase involved in cell wall biosynthesis
MDSEVDVKKVPVWLNRTWGNATNYSAQRLVWLQKILKTLLHWPVSEAELVDGLHGRRPTRHHVILKLQSLKPVDGWHSWDATPWAHPWLTKDNLEAASAFQKRLLTRIAEQISERDARSLRYGFVGNLANNMTMRALPLRRKGYDIDIILHPQDRYVMSQPGWELSDAVLPKGETNIDRLREMGFELPTVEGTVETSLEADFRPLLDAAETTRPTEWASSHPEARFLRQLDALLYPSYMGYLQTLEALQAYDALLAAQAPYLAYLAGRPYLAAQTGGDLWLEAARNDSLGKIQRTSYANAAAILATNPWAYANARRFGFKHVLYVPLLVDTETFSPGQSPARAAWQAKVGGDFFVLSTARFDRTWKGSEVGLEGFCRCAGDNPGARLVLIGWGENRAEALDELGKRQLIERALLLPLSGKRKLVEYLRAADCLLDQFKIGYYGATALEAMSSSLPVVMRLLREQYDALCPTGAPPVLDAASADEVAAALKRLAGSKDLYQQKREESRRWIEKNHSAEVWGRYYGALLYAVGCGRKLSFACSPLRQRLGRDELAYHADNLAAAPPFPEYLI